MIHVNRNAKLTDAQKGRILSLFHDNGHSIMEISAMPQTTKNTVRKWINKFAVNDNHRRERVRFARYMLNDFGVENFEKII